MYGFKMSCEISRGTFDIAYEILNQYTEKCAYYDVLNVWRIIIYDIFTVMSS